MITVSTVYLDSVFTLSSLNPFNASLKITALSSYIPSHPREVAERNCYKDKFDVIFHHGREEKMDENTKSEIVHLYCDVYYKNAKPYIFDQTKSR